LRGGRAFAYVKGMISPALVLAWMTRLVPSSPHAPAFPAVAAAIAEAANEDPDPLDAAATLTAIGYFESHFDPGARSDPRRDPTRSKGPFQLSEPLPPEPLPLVWQARRALVLVRDSQTACGDLTRYASGHCAIAPLVAAERSRVAYRLVHTVGIYVEPALPVRKRDDGAHADR